MTTEELNQVIKIMLSADGGCKHCVTNLLLQLDKAFPGNTAAIKQAFLTEFEEELEIDSIESDQLTEATKKQIKEAVSKAVDEYGDTLKRLSKV